MTAGKKNGKKATGNSHQGKGLKGRKGVLGWGECSKESYFLRATSEWEKGALSVEMTGARGGKGLRGGTIRILRVFNAHLGNEHKEKIV